jgi:hypothetical protein
MPSAASVTFNEGVGVVSLQGKLDAVSTSVTTLNQTLTSALALKAPIESPSFTGTILLPPTNQVLLQQSTSDTVGVSLQSKLDGLSTAITSTSSAAINNALIKAPSNNPVLTGTVTIPSLNAVTSTSTGVTLQSSLDTIASSVTSLSQTQETALALKANLDSPTFTGSVTLPLAANIILTNGTTLTDTLQSKIEFLWNSIDAAVTSIALRAPISNPQLSGNVNLPASTSVFFAGTSLQSLLDLIDTSGGGGGSTAGLAPLADPTFSGVVTLPPASSVSLNGVTTLQGEFNTINTAITTLSTDIADKAPKLNPSFTGIVVMPSDEFVLFYTGTPNPISLRAKLDEKSPLASPTFSGTVSFPSASDVTFGGTALQIELDSISTSITTLTSTVADQAPKNKPQFTGTVTLPLAANVILTNGTTLTDTLQSKIDFLWSSIDSAVTSIALRAPLSNPQFTGNVNLPASTSVFFAGTSLQSLLDLIDTSGGGGGSTVGLAPLADPTFSGVVTLPPASSVSLNGVTTLQGEFNTINTAITTLSTDIADKAPKLNPSFTGIAVMPSDEFVLFYTGTPNPVSLRGKLDEKADKDTPTFTGSVYLPDPDNVFFQTSSSLTESFTSKMNTLSTTIATVQTTQEAAIALKADALDTSLTGTVYLPAATHVYFQDPSSALAESLQGKIDTLEQSIAALTASYPLTVSRLSNGIYTIAFNTPLPDANYSINLTLEVSTNSTASRVNDDYVAYYDAKSASGFTVLVFEQDLGAAGLAGTPANCQYDFICHRQGRLLCHGSVAKGGAHLF